MDVTLPWINLVAAYPSIGTPCEVMAGAGSRIYEATLVDVDGEKVFRSSSGIQVWNVTRWRYGRKRFGGR